MSSFKKRKKLYCRHTVYIRIYEYNIDCTYLILGPFTRPCLKIWCFRPCLIFHAGLIMGNKICEVGLHENYINKIKKPKARKFSILAILKLKAKAQKIGRFSYLHFMLVQILFTTPCTLSNLQSKFTFFILKKYIIKVARST